MTFDAAAAAGGAVAEATGGLGWEETALRVPSTVLATFILVTHSTVHGTQYAIYGAIQAGEGKR